MGIGLVVVVGDALIEGFDLAIQIQRQLRLAGDVSAESGKIHAFIPPMIQSGPGGLENGISLGLTPVTATLTDQPVCETPLTQAQHLMGITPAAEKEQHGGRHHRSQCRNPLGAKEFKQSIQALGARDAPPDQGGADFHGAAQGLSTAQTLFCIETLWMESRQPGQKFVIEPIGFGMLAVVDPEISRLLRWDHDHFGAMAPEPGGQRHPGIAGGLHHNGDVLLSIGEAPPEPLQILSVGLKADVAPEQLSRRIRASGAMGCSAGNVNANSDGHEHLKGLVSRGWMSRRQEATPVIRYERSSPRRESWRCRQVP